MSTALERREITAARNKRGATGERREIGTVRIWRAAKSERRDVGAARSVVTMIVPNGQE